MQIVLAGDTHGDLRFVESLCQIAKSRGSNMIIQVGDFCFVNDRDHFAALHDLLHRYDVTMWWLDGNHDDFDMMEQMGVSPDDDKPTWMTTHICYLPRGSRFTLDGLNFMAFGGASSIFSSRHIPFVNWWPQETIKQSQVDKVDSYPVDVLLSHDAPWGVYTLEAFLAQWDDSLSDKDVRASQHNRKMLALVHQKVNPMLTVHGHYHWFYHCPNTGDDHFIGLAHYAEPVNNYVVLDTEVWRNKRGI